MKKRKEKQNNGSASNSFAGSTTRGKENLGLTKEDQKSYLHGKRQRNLQYGKARSLLRYFQTAENPYFYYAIQLDIDEMITNIFQADHEMITNYELFGDVVSFDTTFRTNKEYWPLALFTGFNHFRKTIIFGASLLYDETTVSFEWLFETFLHAISGKKPSNFSQTKIRQWLRQYLKSCPRFSMDYELST